MLADQPLRATADRTPGGQALVCGERRCTFAELDQLIDRGAAGLRALGVRRGDRVAIHLENSMEAVVAIFAALRAGAVFVPINPTTRAEKLRYIFRDCEPTAVVADKRTSQVVAQALAAVPNTPAVVLVGIDRECDEQASVANAVPFEELLRHPADRGAEGQSIDADLAALIYTSGSTGRPKGVMLSHANIVAATLSINGYLQNRPDDVILNVLPLSFDYGLYQLFLAFHSGASVVVERSFVYPSLMIELMVRERVTALPIVPMVAALLVRHDPTVCHLPHLRYITNTGAVLPPAQIAKLRERLPHVRIFSMYGLTECKRVSYLDPDEIDRRPTSVGKAMDNVEVFLADDDGRPTRQGVGELVIRGANVMQGYWRAPEETARALRPGLLPGEQALYTGDIFRMDEEGFLYFQHRLDDVIKSRGQKVSPREVEDVLHGAPGVSEAVVVGLPDPLVGEALKAYVTMAPGFALTEQDLQLHCSKHLEDFMVPSSIEIVAALPHNASGKLSRRAVQSAAPPS